MDVCDKLRRLCFPWPFQRLSFSRHFIVFRSFLYPHNYNHISLIHLVWKQISYHWTTLRWDSLFSGQENINKFAKHQKRGFAVVGQTIAPSPTLAHPPHRRRPPIWVFESCRITAEMKKAFLNAHPASSVRHLWHVNYSRAMLLCLVQWVYATRTFLLYWFSFFVRWFDFVCLFNPYNIGIFQASSQIKPLETYEIHIKSLIAQ